MKTTDNSITYMLGFETASRKLTLLDQKCNLLDFEIIFIP